VGVVFLDRVAAIDNDRALLGLLKELFSVQGWDVLSLSEGRGAAAWLKRNRPDVVLLDIYLERPISGWTILQELKMDPATRAIPVVILSGAEDGLGDKRDWLAEHGIPVVPKPFDTYDLCQTVKAALEHKMQIPEYE